MKMNYILFEADPVSEVHKLLDKGMINMLIS